MPGTAPRAPRGLRREHGQQRADGIRLRGVPARPRRGADCPIRKDERCPSLLAPTTCSPTWSSTARAWSARTSCSSRSGRGSWSRRTTSTRRSTTSARFWVTHARRRDSSSRSQVVATSSSPTRSPMLARLRP